MKILYCKDSIPKDLIDTLVLLPDSYGSQYSYLWDDYGYKTTFIARYYTKTSYIKLGFIKILFNTQENSHRYIQETFKDTGDGIYQIPYLDKTNAVSIGYKIEYYKILNKSVQDIKTIKRILKQLNDVCYSSHLEDTYRSWVGFSLSLLRDGSDNAILKNGYSIAVGTYKQLKDFYFDVEKRDSATIRFNFNKTSCFSDNINVLIGKNGTGKSQTLKLIADHFTGILSSKTDWPFFNRLVVVSFSPFESFLTNKQLSEKQFSDKNYSVEENQERFERSELINDYSYIGIKSSTDNNHVDLKNASNKSAISLVSSIKDDKDNGWLRDYEKLELITKTLKLAMKFHNIAIKTHTGKIIYGKELLEFSTSMVNPKVNSDLTDAEIIFIDSDNKEIKLSSGQRIYSLLIPCLINEIKDESLILFDEPELYLHPELEVGLMSMMKLILKETSSFGIIATHSSIIVREVKRECVHIFKENGVVLPPEIETFGSSLAEITGYIFDAYNTHKPYQEVLEVMLKQFDSIDDAIHALSGQVGDNAMSYLFELKNKKQKAK